MAHIETVLRNEHGEVLPGATVTVYQAGTTTAASLFSESGLSSSIDNPTTTDTNGVLDVYLAGGTYDLVIQRYDLNDKTIEDVVIGDSISNPTRLFGTTTDATETEIYLDGDDSQILVAEDTVKMVEILVTGRGDNDEVAGYVIRALIQNNGGTTSLQGATSKTVVYEDDGNWDANIEADDTNDAVSVKVTGEAGVTIEWDAVVRSVES